MPVPPSPTPPALLAGCTAATPPVACYEVTHGGGDGVPGGEHEDVGAGDDAGARLLDEGLDTVHEVEAAQREVRRRVPTKSEATAGGGRRVGGLFFF